MEEFREQMRSFKLTALKAGEKDGGKRFKDWQAEKVLDFWDDHALGKPTHSENLAFLARLLVQVNLPHEEPKKGMVAWTRCNGDAYLYIRPGIDVDPKTGKATELGFPFGVIPRLLLIYLVSEAIRTKDPRIKMGRSLSEFVERIGLRRQGGKRGDITRLKEQLRRLLSATIRYGVQPGGVKKITMESDARIASKWMLLWDWDPRKETSQSLFESEVVLDQTFFDEIMRHPVPLDLRVVTVLRQSPLALDLYTWLTYRVSRLERPFKLPWGVLAEQIGSNYGRTTDFQRKASKALTDIRRVWVGLNVDTVHGGILLKPSQPSVPKLPKGSS